MKKQAKKVQRNGQAQAYTKKKLAACKRIKVGAKVVYHGPVGRLDGQRGRVEALESKGGVFVRFPKGKVALVSPFSVLDGRRTA